MVTQRVFLNAANVTGSGATVLVANLLPALYAAAPEAEFTTLVPESTLLASAAVAPNARVHMRRPRRGVRNDIRRLWDLHRGLDRLIRDSGADVCLTLGDVGPSRLPCRHVVLLHNALLVYPVEELGGIRVWSPVKRRYLIWQLRRSITGATDVIVQTPVMRDRLGNLTGIAEERVHVIPQPVPQHVATTSSVSGRSALASCRKHLKLLFLAASYPHKNHRILPAVARELRKQGLDENVQIFVTLGPQAPLLLRESLASHPDVITDIGRLAPDSVPEALADASALFLPTLLESFGLIYLEAMACRRPILTSDRDFARWMCGDVATYFDPHDERSIVGAIRWLLEMSTRRDIAKSADTRLAQFPGKWDEVGSRFAEILGL